MLTVAAIHQRVARIREAADGGDCERAHALEDDLHREVLGAIAKRGLVAPPYLLAAAALLTAKDDFPRHCA